MEQLEKGMLVATFANGDMEFINIQYNPTEFTLEKGVQNAEINIPGLDSPLQQFIRGQTEKLTLELFFDTTDDGMGSEATSVTEETDRIYSLLKIKPEDHTPPLVSFLWNEKFPGCDLIEWTGNQKRTDFTRSFAGVGFFEDLTFVFRSESAALGFFGHLNLRGKRGRNS